MTIHTDINECSEGTHRCAHTCINEGGSYSCSCQSGYQLTSDGRGCMDVNECSDGTDACDQICTNTIGSYTCSCNSGYQLASDRQTCNGEYSLLIPYTIYYKCHFDLRNFLLLIILSNL